VSTESAKVQVSDSLGVTSFGYAGTDEVLAIVVNASTTADGISFLTNPSDQFQVGLLGWPAGHVIDAHTHVPLDRTISRTSEVLFIRSGVVNMSLFTDEGAHLIDHELRGGDVVVLLTGGHGFTMLEPSQIIEIKQGPYLGEKEKIRFTQQITGAD
jgi:mannose-6-phosphate isomerase-like protein (cupin superfamily)